MKETQDKPYRLMLCFAFSIVSILSCANQSHSNEMQEIQTSDHAPLVKSNIDTSLQLKFKTGVRAILEDSKGNVWFGSHQEGVCLFDGEKLTYFTEEDGLSNNQVRSIFEDSNGVVWFEGGKGISSFDGKKIITHSEKNYTSKQQWQTDTNDLWFKGDEIIGYNEGEGQPGVYRYDGKEFTYHVFPIDAKMEEHSYYSVSTPFVKGKSNMFWFGTYGAVLGFDGSSFTTIDNKSLGLNKETGYLHIRSIYEDSKGNLWIGNNGIGVLHYDGDSTINFSALHGLISDNSQRRGGYRSTAGSLEHVFSIGEDRYGNIWFGDRDTGAWRYDGESLRNYTPKDGLTTTHIWQIYDTKMGELWFAMDDGSVCKFNGETFERIF